MSEEEIWKDIKDYEGLYQVSNLGNVKRIKFINIHSNFDKETILKQGYNLQGYPIISLCKNCNAKTRGIHRLVAKTFIPNPENRPCVNHIDGNKSNNRVSNLEWVTQKENIIHSFKNGLQKPTWKNMKSDLCPNSVKVKQYDKQDNLIKVWNCMRDVQIELGIYATGVSLCCKGKQKTAGGYKWTY